MSEVAALIADMVRAGVDPELIGRTAAALAEREPVKIVDEQAERKRAADRDRMRAKREENRAMSRDVAEVADKVSPLCPPDKEHPTPQEINPPYIPPSNSVSKGAGEAGFSEFWSIYPNRVGKRDAEKAFVKALKRSDLETILAGLRRYAAKTDDRPWCNPATWLNQDRWGDAPADVPQRQGAGPPRKPSAFDAYDEIARMKGWTDEPAGIPGNHQDAQRLPAVDGGYSGVVVDLRRGADWSR